VRQDNADDSGFRRDGAMLDNARGKKSRSDQTGGDLVRKLACLKAGLTAVVTERGIAIDSLESALALWI
jgi:hypothetical protein